MLAYPLPDNEAFGNNTKAAKRAAAALAGATVAGAPVHVSGIDALSNQTGGGGGPGVLLESVLGGLGALVVLAFVFASLLAFVPLLMAIVSIMTTFLVLWGVTTVTSVSMIVEFLVALIGLGVAIDYSLLIVVRWREERAHGYEGDEAVVRAMQTAGRAVVFSGTTVAIGLLAMIVLPLPFLRSIGYAGMLIPLDQRDRRHHAAADRPRQGRSAARLAAHPLRRSGQPVVDALGFTGGQAALVRGSGCRRHPRRPGHRRHRLATGAGQRQHPVQARGCPFRLGRSRALGHRHRGADPDRDPRPRRCRQPRGELGGGGQRRARRGRSHRRRLAARRDRDRRRLHDRRRLDHGRSEHA